MKYLLPVLFLILILFNLQQKHKKYTMSHYLKNSDIILATGDSLTKGHGAPDGKSYPDYLSKLTGHTVINAGLNGETSQEGLQRLPSLLDLHHPKLTLLCYGGNDILQNRSMAQLAQNLKEMIRKIRASGSDVILIAVPNFTLFGLEPLPLYKIVAKETKTPLLKGVLSEILENPAYKSDQVHPNAKGYKIFADALYKKLQEEGWIKE
jgi:lysophospholipase L1-like esterase